jgi:calcineurin-like phosphoesterase family protein
MNIWWTADKHHNHANIIRLCRRPYKTVDEMNVDLIKKHNERVKKEDMVFDLGDFLFRNSPGGKEGMGGLEKAEHFLSQYNGTMVRIKGNHDRNNSNKTPIEKIYIRFGGYKICMVHNPSHADPTCDLNFCGHVHLKWKFKKWGKTYLINVGVDQWGFRPVNFSEIMKAFRNWQKNEEKKEEK